MKTESKFLLEDFILLLRPNQYDRVCRNNALYMYVDRIYYDGSRCQVLEYRLLKCSYDHFGIRFLCLSHCMYRHDIFDDGISSRLLPQLAESIPVNCIDAPYRVHIDESRSTLETGVYIRLQTDIRCQLRVYWFVTIQQFYKEIDAVDFRSSLTSNQFLKDHCVHEEMFNFETSGNYVQHAKFPDSENYLIGTNEKRQKYPLVIVVHSSIDEDSQEFFRLPIQIAALHVKSSLPNDPATKFIVQISKLQNGQSLVLQDIFRPGTFASDDTCVICLTERVNHVLLPCTRKLFNMQELTRWMLLSLVALFILIRFVHCRNIIPETIDSQERSVRIMDYESLCHFRKSRLCNYLHAIDNEKKALDAEDQAIWKRGVSRFYSNW